MKKPYRWKLNLIGVGKWFVLAIALLLLTGMLLLGLGIARAGWIVAGIGIALLVFFLILLGVEQHQDREMNEWKR